MTFVDKIFGNLIIPLSYYLRGDLRFWYFRKYKKHLSMSQAEIRAFQLERLKKLVRHSYNSVPYYRELFEKINLRPEDIRSLKDLKKIPLLDKRTVINKVDQLKCPGFRNLIECGSGGSSGNRVVVFKDKRYNEISRAVWLRDFYSSGIEPGKKIAWIWASEIETVPLKTKLLNRLLWRINRRIIFT